jgi:exonuclease VII large subunit
VKENQLIKICVVGSIAGIISIYFVSFLFTAEEVNPGDITESYLGRKVKVSGSVEDLRFHENGHIFFDLKDDRGSIDIVIWEDRVQSLMLSGTDFSKISEGVGIELTGYVESYKGNFQIVV